MLCNMDVFSDPGLKTRTPPALMVGLFSIAMSAELSSLVTAEMQRVSSSLMEGLKCCAVRKISSRGREEKDASSVNIMVRESLQLKMTWLDKFRAGQQIKCMPLS